MGTLQSNERNFSVAMGILKQVLNGDTKLYSHE